MNRATLKRWLIRLTVIAVCIVALILFVGLPVGASFLITNSRFQYRERGPKTPEAVGLQVMNAEFVSSDGIPLRGWWNPGDNSMPVIILVHGLNRSRLELLERAAESNRRGYGVLLFDLRNHGESGKAYTTIGIFESRDVCAASRFVKEKSGSRPQILWGVSMGASSAITTYEINGDEASATPKFCRNCRYLVTTSSISCSVNGFAATLSRSMCLSQPKSAETVTKSV